jgi:predicted ATPase
MAVKASDLLPHPQLPPWKRLPMAADLFVSYARKDRDQVLPWVQQFQQAGISLWIDEQDIDAAHLWTQEIIEAIRGCTVLLLMLSPAAASSEHVVREVTFALEQHKRILPAVLQPVELPSSLQYPLTGLQQIELFHGDSEAKRTALLRALTRLGVAAPGWQTAASSSAASSAERRASSRSGATLHNLPRSISRFIGREQQVAEVTAELAATPLLTLTGTGGTGKTRLALQVASQVLADYLDGVWFVELAALSEPSLVPQQVATALGVREEPGRPLVETLTEYLQPRQLLLVLDNCEHLVAACAELARRLLEACPDLRVLATSREALGVPGEALFRVPTLTTPIPPPPPVEQLTQYEAVRLFIDRALLSQPAFAVTNANAPSVAEICHRLDGIPLAIELAAARVKALPMEQIARRLDDRFKLLTGGSRTGLPRQQTLRAAIDWSYDLLAEPERALLLRLSMFAGGWDLEAADAVCAGEAIEDWEVLDLLASLVEKSLVQYEEAEGAGRYRLLETLREYGREQVGEGERAELERRHAEHFLAWAERAGEELRQGREQQVWLERLELEHDNLRAALDWAIKRGDVGIGLRLAVALELFWHRRSYLTEARERLAAVLALPDPSEPGAGTSAPLRLLRARALRNAGAQAWRQGDYEPARTLLEESLALQRTLDDPRGVATALSTLGAVVFSQGDFDASREFGTQALAIVRELGSPRSVAVELHNLANVARAQSDYQTATPLYAESLALSRELGDRYDVAYCLHGLGLVAYCQGEWGSARGYYDECLAIRREIGDRVGMSMALYTLGILARDQGDYGAARDCFEESLALRRELGDKRGIALSLYGLGTLASQEGDEATAQPLLEESLAMLQKGGDRHMAASASADLGALLSRRGEYGAARPLLEASLAIFREAGDRPGIGAVLSYLGTMALDQGDADAAGASCGESLAAFRQVGDRHGMAQALEGLARVAGARGEAERAAQLYAAAAALREALGAPVPPADRADHERRVAAARATLGEAAFAAAWAQGRALEALALALDDTRAG